MENSEIDELDEDCRNAFDAVRTGRMSLDEFICWICDYCTEAFVEGEDSLKQDAPETNRRSGS